MGSKKKIHYKYALDKNDSIVDIQSINATNKPLISPLRCLGCGGEVIAHLKDDIRTKHFQHKPGEQCSVSYETYLHNLAKTSFFERYKQCLNTKKPFFVLLERNTKCSHYLSQTGLFCVKSETQEIDLTRHFDVIQLEKGYEGFIPDLLLSSTLNEKSMFIEMAVSHKCDPHKIESGIPIIEFEIFQEQDITKFLKPIKIDIGNVNTYNFKALKPRRYSCDGTCSEIYVRVFTLYKTGKLGMTHITAGKYFTATVPPSITYQHADNPTKFPEAYTPGDYMPFAKELIAKGFNIKSCAVCKHRRSKMYGYQSVQFFCKKLSHEVPLNKAFECKDFEPIKTVNSLDWFMQNVKYF